MKKQIKLFAVIIGLCTFFIIGSTYAGTTVSDIIRMEDAIYSKHKKSIVKFTHKKHSTEYKATCGECHHDKDNKPLNDLKAGDDVQKCSACHKIPKEVKGKKKKAMSSAEVYAHHVNALHDNCKGCHKAFNKENKKKKIAKKAPTTCAKCHIKE